MQFVMFVKKSDLIKPDGTVDKLLLNCTNCEVSIHPFCIEMSEEMQNVVRKMPWLCNSLVVLLIYKFNFYF